MFVNNAKEETAMDSKPVQHLLIRSNNHKGTTMKTKLLFILLSLLVASCTKDDITPPDDTPKKQQDIPWPSLAKSPWPMNHGNPQSTGRSNYLGPTQGAIDWERDLNYSSTGVAIGEDSSIIACSRDTLFSYAADGHLKWQLKTPTNLGFIKSTPIIDARGMIYIGLQAGVIGVDKFGVKQWECPLWAYGIFDHQGSCIGLDGTLYFLLYGNNTGDGILVAISQQGQELWRLQNSGFSSGHRATLTFSPDGNTLYIPGRGVSVHALDIPSRTIKWKFGNTDLQQLAPMVDSDGNVYVLGISDTINNRSPSLFCLTPSGKLKWSYAHGNALDPNWAGDPTIDVFGNIYFGFDTLYSVSAEGKLRWKMPLNGIADAPLVCDIAGKVYLSILVDYTAKFSECINTDGKILWQCFYQVQDVIDASPAITYNNKLIVPTWRGRKLYAFK
jgi:outer membrane protein assembly factor BamB